MEDGRIADSQITASTEWRSNHGPTNARLNRPAQSGTSGSWSVRTNDVNQWIQVEFESSTWMTGVIIQGRSDSDQWVIEYKVQYSTDGENWQYVMTADNQDEQVWSTNRCNMY